MLKTRIVNGSNFKPSKWENAPIIVANNATKDALNAEAAVDFARRTKREIHWYYAIDRHENRIVNDEALVKKLTSLHSGKTKQRLGRIPLVIGMPVLVAQNFDVEGGIVNGSRGTVKRIRYVMGDGGKRYLRSVILEIPGCSTEALPHLQTLEIPILTDVTPMKFKHPYTHQSCTIKRTQVPVVPAFAMTAHRAQGQTMEKVIVDLESCRGTEAPYVMLSRARSLEGVLVLRPFSAARITCRLSQDARRERRRLEILSLTTKMELGSTADKVEATLKLSLQGLEPCVAEQAALPGLEAQKNIEGLLNELQGAEYPPTVRALPKSTLKTRRPTKKRSLPLARVNSRDGSGTPGQILLIIS